MTYQVPYSSSPGGPPSTPDRRSNNGNNGFSFGGPSTTPAGPPPSSAASFTPAGPPPSSYLGSSMMDTGSPIKPLSFSPSPSNAFGQSSASGAFGQSTFSPQRSGLSNMFQSSPQRPFEASRNSLPEQEEDEYLDEEEDQRYPKYHDEDASGMTDDEPPYDDGGEPEGMDYENEDQRGFDQSSSDLGIPTPPLLRGSRNGYQSKYEGSQQKSTSKHKEHDHIYSRIARDIYNQMQPPDVTEEDDIILDTEALVSRLFDEGTDVVAAREILKVVPSELVALWQAYAKRIAPKYVEGEHKPPLGPLPRAPAFTRANFLAGLALQIHQPPEQIMMYGPRVKPLPLILLEWMDEYHNGASIFDRVQACRPSPASHPLFWETIFSCILRGKVLAVVNIMNNAGWRYAKTGNENIPGLSDDDGFSGVALENVNKVIGAATSVLSQCPAKDGDWHIRDDHWKMFRLQVAKALEDLKTFAEGRNRTTRSPLGLGRGRGSNLPPPTTYSETVQRAESRVPWVIYQNLITLYSLVLGEKDVIVATSQDWCEATVGLLVWWDEGKNDTSVALNRSQSNSALTDKDVYRLKLRKSFHEVTSGNDLAVDTMDPIQVALASLFDNDNESVVGFLRGWSGPVSSAVAEIATWGGWLPKPDEKALIGFGELGQGDLDLLQFNQSPSKSDGVKDQTLISYARGLARRGQLKSSAIAGGPQNSKDGWELAIAVLGRLESASRSAEMIGEFLKSFSLDSSVTVDKLWRLLNDLGHDELAESTAESYANLLAEDSHNYGEALWYYALAHRNEKVKDVLDLLISFSLVQSVAYPPEPEVDEHLRKLIFSPKNALTEMARLDLDAAELLQKLLSGYATLRKFYDLRDAAVLQTKGTKPKLGAKARKVEAASALIAVIISSDDNIRGGLYDEGREAVVSVDFLLALLGEAMAFVDQPDYNMPVAQIEALLKAVEDLQTVGSRVYSACLEFLQTVIASGQGLKGSTPADLLRKSTSGLSGTSSFSMVGSSMLASQFKQSMSSSGVLVKGPIKRGWDWRHGITAGTTGDDVLRILRLGLAKSLAKAWLMEADNKM